MATNYALGGSGSDVAHSKQYEPPKQPKQPMRIPGWDTSTKIGWFIVGLFGGLFGLLACFLVNHNTARFSRTMLATGVGILVSILLGSLMVMVFGGAIVGALGGSSGGYTVDYVGV